MRRTVIGILILVLGAGAGLVAGFYYFGNDKSTYVRTTAPASDLVTDIGNCTANELTVSYADNDTAPLKGPTDVVVYLNNLSKSSRCSLEGTPAISLTDAVGNQLGQAAAPINNAKPTKVTLNPSERATLTIHYNTSTNQAGIVCTNGIALLKISLAGAKSYLTIANKTNLWCPGFTTTNFSKA